MFILHHILILGAKHIAVNKRGKVSSFTELTLKITETNNRNKLKRYIIKYPSHHFLKKIKAE